MLLALLTVLASIGLLTLSGWFLSAAAVAGLSIARETFNYMLPGAFVRGFAMDALRVVGASVSLLTTPPSSCSLICECFSLRN